MWKKSSTADIKLREKSVSLSYILIMVSRVKIILQSEFSVFIFLLQLILKTQKKTWMNKEKWTLLLLLENER